VKRLICFKLWSKKSLRKTNDRKVCLKIGLNQPYRKKTHTAFSSITTKGTRTLSTSKVLIRTTIRSQMGTSTPRQMFQGRRRKQGTSSSLVIWTYNTWSTTAIPYSMKRRCAPSENKMCQSRARLPSVTRKPLPNHLQSSISWQAEEVQGAETLTTCLSRGLPKPSCHRIPRREAKSTWTSASSVRSSRSTRWPHERLKKRWPRTKSCNKKAVTSKSLQVINTLLWLQHLLLKSWGSTSFQNNSPCCQVGSQAQQSLATTTLRWVTGIRITALWGTSDNSGKHKENRAGLTSMRGVCKSTCLKRQPHSTMAETIARKRFLRQSMDV